VPANRGGYFDYVKKTFMTCARQVLTCWIIGPRRAQLPEFGGDEIKSYLLELLSSFQVKNCTVMVFF
jgi:hypothetical protein